MKIGVEYVKISKSFILRSVMDEYVIVPVGDTAAEFNGVISTNSTGAFLWDLLKEDISFDELKSKLLDEFDVDEKSAENDINDFLNQLKKHNIL